MGEQQTSKKGAASGSLKKMRMQKAMSKDWATAEDAPEAEQEDKGSQSAPPPEHRPEQADDQRSIGRSSVRVTVDLKAQQHKFLKHFAVEAGSTSTRVVRGLLDLLEQDDDLRERLLRDLQ